MRLAGVAAAAVAGKRAARNPQRHRRARRRRRRGRCHRRPLRRRRRLLRPHAAARPAGHLCRLAARARPGEVAPARRARGACRRRRQRRTACRAPKCDDEQDGADEDRVGADKRRSRPRAERRATSVATSTSIGPTTTRRIETPQPANFTLRLMPREASDPASSGRGRRHRASLKDVRGGLVEPRRWSRRWANDPSSSWADTRCCAGALLDRGAKGIRASVGGWAPH